MINKKEQTRLLKALLDFKGKDKEQRKQMVSELIVRRRRQVLVHSLIYYRYNYNIIDDKTWDLWARELVSLQERYPNTSKKIKVLYSEFKDFDASTGFHLCNCCSGDAIRASQIALNLIEVDKNNKQKRKKKKRK